MENSWLQSTRWLRAVGASSFDEVDIDPRITVTESREPNGARRLTARLKDNCGMSIVPKRILRSGDRTIVFWEDGTKTIVKRAEDEPDNDYAAFTAAFAIKLFGSNSALKRMIFKKLEHQHKNPKQPKQKPKPKFGVGDIVRTRYGLKFGEEYDNITFLSGMEVENAEITTVDPIDNTYHVNHGAYWYSEKMLALVRKKDDKE